MENPEQFQEGGYVKIVKDGSWDDVDYKKDEIWKTIKREGAFIWWVERDGKRTKVCSSVTDSYNYGVECVWIGMELPMDYPIF